jgi:hypothetical protein
MAPHQFPNFPPKGSRKGETKYNSDRHPSGFDQRHSTASLKTGSGLKT